MSAPKAAARAARDSTAFRVAARVGYVVLGIVHLVIGGIAISIASGGGGQADQGGAMAQIAQAPLGIALLWVIVVGLVALAIWQVTEAVVEQDPDDKKKWGHRAKYVGTALAYLAIAGTALMYALGGGADSGQSTQSLSAQIMSAPAGVVLIAVIGIAVFAVGVAFVVRGITRKFEENLTVPGGALGTAVVIFSVVGYIAKGVAVAVTGILFVVAAVTHDPQAASGLDGGLRALAALPIGLAVLWVVGAGLVVYGLFCFARARYARM